MEVFRWLSRRRPDSPFQSRKKAEKKTNAEQCCPILSHPKPSVPSMNASPTRQRTVVRKISERDGTTGRFEIIHDQIKDTVMTESDAEETESTASEQTADRAVDTPSAMTANAIPHVKSRFNLTVVPVDAKFVRGRWHCYDFEDDPKSASAVKPEVRSDMIEIEAHKPGRSSGTSSNASSINAEKKDLVDGHAVSTPRSIGHTPEPPTAVVSPLVQNDPAYLKESLTPVPGVSPCSIPTYPSPSATPEPVGSNHVTDVRLPFVVPGAAGASPLTVSTPIATSSFMGGLSALSDPFHISHDRSWLADLLPAPGSQAPCASPQGLGEPPFSDNPTAAVGVAAQNPIDNKIEQAMDLVKTHLMYAVREEVEVLRAKIVELEKTVLRLETENTVLREHVSADVLSRIAQLSAPASAPVSVTASQSSSQSLSVLQTQTAPSQRPSDGSNA